MFRGHCLPIDPSYLAWRVKRHLGYTFRFVELANDVNEHMPDYVHSRVTALLNRSHKSVNGSRILLLGLAYKRGTSDWRESPSVAVAERLADTDLVVVLVDHIEFDPATIAQHARLVFDTKNPMRDATPSPARSCRGSEVESFPGPPTPSFRCRVVLN